MNKPSFNRIAVLLLAIIQPIAALISNPSTSDTMQVSSPTITPADYAFIIWGFITVGSFAYAIYQVLPNRINAKLHNRIAPYVAGTFAGFSVWLYAASKNWLWVTVLVFILMGYCLYKLYKVILDYRSVNRFSTYEQTVVYGTFSLYTGWTMIAIFANIASAIKYYGVSDLGTGGIVWQATILISATIAAMITIQIFKASTAYTATVLWAFAAILVATLSMREVAGVLPYISILAITGILIQYLRLRDFSIGRPKQNVA